MKIGNQLRLKILYNHMSGNIFSVINGSISVEQYNLFNYKDLPHSVCSLRLAAIRVAQPYNLFITRQNRGLFEHQAFYDRLACCHVLGGVRGGRWRHKRVGPPWEGLGGATGE